MKKFRIILAILTLICCFSFYNAPVKATQLPQPIVEYLKSKYPDVEIRFDGLVELPDHTIYLPVTPLTYGKVENPATVIKTIPANTNFSKKPDMILFANNLALLKVVRVNNQLTVNYSPEIPLSVKLGLLPQDLIVPHGLILPMELKVILGNLKIALKQKKDEDDLVFYGEPAPKNTTKVNIITQKKGSKGLPELDCIKNKVLYVSSFKDNKINMIDSLTGRIDKTMKLPSVPSNMILTQDGRYLLVPSMSLNKIFVIDTFTNIFLKDIEVGKLPTSILLPINSQKAYVANKLSSSIAEIDLENMLLTKEINAIGSPDNLISIEDSENIFYNDSNSGKIYRLNPDSGISTIVTQANNVSKIAQSGKYLFILSRSNNELIVYDFKNNAEITKIKVGEKPVDIQILDKRKEIYVLAGGSDEINIIDMNEFKLKKNIALNSGGFPGKITVIERENKALITNQDAYQIIIYDMNKEKILGNIPIDKTISFLQISK
ncbi:MAG TPA: hypothetical protein DDW90_02110 [Cyanobacteria bacterium UBA9971]|nr:hypothetical protein [Cyanobacteria bacterium UBA9971]